jgi:hypothetical protein
LEERRAWMVPRGACSRMIGGPGERQLWSRVSTCLLERRMRHNTVKVWDVFPSPRRRMRLRHASRPKASLPDDC